MTKKAEFNADEWQTVAEAPLFAGARVVKAHGGGTIRESLAMGKVYAHAREQQDNSELLDDLVATPPSMDAKRLAEDDLATLTQTALRAALEVLEGKATPEEIEAYKQFILALANAAANAHEEGGFLGIGGQKVSAEEQAAIDDIAATLQA